MAAISWSALAEDAASNGVVGDQAEKPFDEIDPGRRCRGEAKVEARVALEPSLNLGVLVGRVVVDDEMQIERFGGVAVALSRRPRIADSRGVQCRSRTLQAIDFSACGPYARRAIHK